MPDLDKEQPSTMTAVSEIRNVQLNEKISETQYQILHPETKADQVITNELKRFVSDADKAKWNKSADDNVNSLHYRGEWKTGETYKQHDVVYCKPNKSPDIDSATGSTPDDGILMFYVWTGETATKATSSNRPTYNNQTTSSWINIDFRSYLASRAQTVRVIDDLANAGQEVLVTFVVKTGGADGYKTICVDDTFLYNPSTNTLKVTNIEATKVTADEFVGDLDGVARAAINYIAYERDEDGNKVVNGNKTEEEIDNAIVGIKNQINQITGGTGGPILANSISFTKDNDPDSFVSFNGREPLHVDIKQTYSTEDITDLLDDDKLKIQLKWLPDSVLGQLEYQGTWDPSPDKNPTSVDNTKRQKGYYFIAVDNGNYNPDGSLNSGVDSGANPTYYLVGDWAVFNGTTWDKVDNTDAVTMVNGQIGSVQLYKEWSASTTFFRGDIVKVGSVLYICNVKHTSGSTFATDEAKWDLFGRTYSATDGIKLDGTTFKHSTTAPTSSTTETTLQAGQTFQIPGFTTDAFGHVSHITTETIQLGTDFIDTVREIQVNGSSVLAKNVKTPLNFGSTTWIDASYANNILSFSHKNNGATGAMDLTTNKVQSAVENEDILYAGQGYTIPSFKFDGAGHITEASLKTFRLAATPFKHSHFNVSTDKDGSQMIAAYTADVANEAWVKNSDNKLKFYLGNINPTNTTQMNFNGILNATSIKQAGNKVLDSLTRVYSGKNLNGGDIFGTYNVTTNALDLGTSGVVAGVYSAIAVNAQGIVTAGGHILEFGSVEDADPSDSLAIGGLFFRMHSTNDRNAA